MCYERCKKYFSIGFKKVPDKLLLGDVSEIVDLLKCHCIKIGIPEINQFSEGLETLNVLKYIKKYPDIMRDCFVDNGVRLTSGTLNINSNCFFFQYFNLFSKI